MFGRLTEPTLGETQYKKFEYTEDGEFGLVGLISGFWVRAFNPVTERYKSMQMSIKEGIDSLKAVFNVGVSVDTIEGKQVLRIEDLKYYYQDTVAVKLPNQITNVARDVDASMFFSAIDIGYSDGGKYENEIGLDEPNTKTEFITPLRKTNNKFTKLSKVRSDEYGMEILRRKPQESYPDEDMTGDEHNWFLDLKRPEDGGTIYTQRNWDDDRLVEEPTGVLVPDTYRAFIFTPLRMLLRHGWIIRSGMEQVVNMTKYIKYISSVANTTLSMWFLNEDAPIQENDDVLVSSLERARLLPQRIKFTHPIDDDLMDWLMGTTPIMVGGEIEDVPNYYFKVQFTNEKEELETGYIISIKPKSGGFELYKCNDNILTN